MTVVSESPAFDPDVFWDHVRGSGDGCWVWTGKRTDHGYGVVRGFPFTETFAHRLAWTMAVGPIPARLWVLHRCDNPPCVNPEHLFLGTPLDNVRDSQSKGRRPVAAPFAGRRYPFPRTACVNGHEWTDETEIRYGDGRRRCRECARERNRAYLTRKAA